MKKKISLLLVILMLVTLMPMSMAVSEEKAVMSTQKFTLNGKSINAAAYIIGGKNYLKLRDMAALLNGKKAQFNVGYDSERGLVKLELAKPYKILASDLKPIASKEATATMQDMNLVVDGKERKLRSALISGSNYIELRNLSELVGFDVDFDSNTSTVRLKSDKLKKECKLKFYLEDFDGKKINIADILSEHDYTFVNVWATYCGPCKMEMPELAKLGSDYKDKVGFIGIVSDIEPSDTKDYFRVQNIDTAKAILKKSNAKFTNLVATKEARAFLENAVSGFPTSLILDSEGNIVDTLVGASPSGNYERYKRAIDKFIK